MSEVSIRATLKLQNAPLAKLAEELGGVRYAADEVGVCASTYSAWLNFKSCPGHRHLKSKRMKDVVRKLCKLTDSSLEAIFPKLSKQERELLANDHVHDRILDTERITHEVEVQHLSYEPDTYNNEFDAELIQSVLKSLSSREQEVIKLRFGIGYDTPYTLAEVGSIFKLSKEQIRSIESKALRMLQNPSRASRLESLVEDLVPGGVCDICRKHFRNENALKLHKAAEHS